MSIIQKWLDWCRDRSWIHGYPISPALSRRINRSLDSGKIPAREGPHIVRLDGVRLWAANFPYSYGEAMARAGVSGLGVMPDRKTQLRLREAVEESDFGESSDDF